MIANHCWMLIGRSLTIIFCASFAPSILVGLVACGLGNQVPPPSVVSSPAVINLYPSSTDSRLYVFLTGIGQQGVSLPLIFDTGSAGITLYGRGLFPPDLMDANGSLIFPEGQDYLTYKGITVMSPQVSREYGGKGGTQVTGYVGYAEVIFGDSSGELKTRMMPVFLYFSVTPYNAADPTGFGAAVGLFGVDGRADPIAAGNIPADAIECAPGGSPPCYIVSVLKYLHYGEGINAGFRLTSAQTQPCTAVVPADCPPAPILTVGLTSSLEAGFATQSLVCPPDDSEQPPYGGPQSIVGYEVCDKSVMGTITVTNPTPIKGLPGTAISGPVLFDSGTVSMEIQLSAATKAFYLPEYASVQVALPASGFTYQYTAGLSEPTVTLVDSDINNGQSHFGFGYFESNSFFIDYVTQTEWWLGQ